LPRTLTKIIAHDVRFQTSRDLDGSDAMNQAPDYSAADALIETGVADGLVGHGMTFTIGRGNEVCVKATESLAPLVAGRMPEDITADMGHFWRSIVGESQLRWIGPEKGAVHLATAAIVNAIDDDLRRARIIRREIGYDRTWMVDANQVWEVDQAIANMQRLAEFKPWWIEEPLSPDDVLGHAKVAEAVRPLGIGVATGEHWQNRVMFKQFLQAGALDFCQIDACRLGGVNEVLAVLLMAAKFGVPVCPHAGGVGLCELVQHLSIFDYIAVSGSLDNCVLDHVDHLHEHFVDPVVIRDGRYMPPENPGYSAALKSASLADHTFPTGAACGSEATRPAPH